MRHKIVFGSWKSGFFAISEDIEDAASPAFGFASLEKGAGYLLVDGKRMWTKAELFR